MPAFFLAVVSSQNDHSGVVHPRTIAFRHVVHDLLVLGPTTAIGAVMPGLAQLLIVFKAHHRVVVKLNIAKP